MSIQVVGRVVNVFQGRPTTDNKTGEVRPAKSKVQLLYETKLENGGVEMDMLTFNTDRPLAFEAARNKIVRCPLKMWEGENGGAGLYVPKGVEIELLDENGKKVGLVESKPDKDKRAA
jgi:hypothetical protein